MRVLFIALLIGMSQFLSAQSETITDLSDRFLKLYTADGRVDYAQIKEKSFVLESIMDKMAAFDFETLSGDDQKAYLINAYNLIVIHQVTQKFPIDAPMSIPGFFKKNKFQLGPKKYTLDEIENELLRERFPDARIHFALVCGAVSCPTIRSEAYQAAKLDTQLEEQTDKGVNDPTFIYKKDGKLFVSEIFKWFEGDFKADGGVLTFINKYKKQPYPKIKLAYYPYNWTLNNKAIASATNDGASSNNNATTLVLPASNIQTFTPSALLKKGQYEAVVFNNLYTDQAFYDGDGERVSLDNRQTYFTSTLTFNYGISKSTKFNIGLDVNLRSVTNGTSALGALAFQNDSLKKASISSFGPKLRIAPFEGKRFSITSTFWIPVAENPELSDSRTPWFDYNRYTWWNQFFYDYSFGDFQWFAEADLLFRFPKSASSYADGRARRTELQTPVSSFLSYFPNSNTTVYIMGQYSPEFGLNSVEGSESGFAGYFTQLGAGAKYQLTPYLNLELLYTNFVSGQSKGAGQTFNLGLRYIH